MNKISEFGWRILTRTPIWIIATLLLGNTIAVMSQMTRGEALNEHGYWLNILCLGTWLSGRIVVDRKRVPQ